MTPQEKRQMDPAQWQQTVKAKLDKLAPDKQAIKNWVEGQNFKVGTGDDLPGGGWWFEADNQNMTLPKLIVRWNGNKLEVECR
jgi:hypothetical protein